MPMLFCFYGKIEHGGYFIGALGLLFGAIFMFESIYVVSGSQTEDVQFISFILLIGVIILIVSPIFLLYGTYKKNSRFVSVWLVLNVLVILITLLDNLSEGIMTLIFITLIDLYCWYFVYRLYQKFKSEEGLLPINNRIPVNHSDLPPSYDEVSLTK